MPRSPILSTLTVLLLAGCQQQQQQQPPAAQGPAPGSPEWKMQNAMSAGPAAIASAATLMDWPSTPDGKPTQLRAGTNGWTCFPDDPSTPSNDPMCLDATFVQWADAWQGHKTPQLKTVGFGYMLQGGEGSNTDPYAKQATPDNQWGKAGPHLMMVVPNAATLGSLTTDPAGGGPWLMWKATPYAHVMMPASK